VCYRCGKSGHFIAKCPISSESDKDKDKKGKKKENKKYYKTKGGDAHICREWDFDESSTDSSSHEDCNTRVLGVQSPGVNIIIRCAGTKSHTYDESWHMIECHIFTT
jgi:hypothetical protein